MAIMAAIRKTRSMAKPRSPRGAGLLARPARTGRSAPLPLVRHVRTGVLRERQRVLLLAFRVFDLHRRDTDAHDTVLLHHHTALGSQDDVVVGVEEEGGLFAVDRLGGDAIIFQVGRRFGRRWGRRPRFDLWRKGLR